MSALLCPYPVPEKYVFSLKHDLVKWWYSHCIGDKQERKIQPTNVDQFNKISFSTATNDLLALEDFKHINSQ